MSKKPEYRHTGRVDVFEEVKKPKKKNDVIETIVGAAFIIGILILIF